MLKKILDADARGGGGVRVLDNFGQGGGGGVENLGRLK